jgi:hypothetical protein
MTLLLLYIVLTLVMNSIQPLVPAIIMILVVGGVVYVIVNRRTRL